MLRHVVQGGRAPRPRGLGSGEMGPAWVPWAAANRRRGHASSGSRPHQLDLEAEGFCVPGELLIGRDELQALRGTHSHMQRIRRLERQVEARDETPRRAVRAGVQMDPRILAVLDVAHEQAHDLINGRALQVAYPQPQRQSGEELQFHQFADCRCDQGRVDRLDAATQRLGDVVGHHHAGVEVRPGDQ